MSSDSTIPRTDAPRPDAAFVTTRWTSVLAAQGGTPEASKALGELCEAYWMPVFRFLRREGRSDDEARELTQEFFGRVLARDGFAHADPRRGRFRSFLLGAVRHFLGDLRDRERALKRGGGTPLESLDLPASNDSSPGFQIADARAEIPDTFFDRQWAFAILERAFTQLAAEQEAAGKSTHYAVLKPWLVGETAALPQSNAARALGLSEGAIKVSIHRLRKRFRELVRAEVIHTLPDPAEADAELSYLIDVLAAG
jgi:RNA polymerase sigma-70 factor (ECF subfamily)